ncbi:transporter [Flavobacterium sp.]|uniref:transporter n=1 Tax=Flavobacterium sp. TaxID=239 RepID=UPI00374D7A5F
MKLFKSITLIGVLLITVSTYSQFTEEINSNRPGKSMMAFSVGKSVFQAEGGMNYITEKHELLDYKASGFNADVQLRWGLFFEQLELIGDFQYQFDKYKSNFVTENRSAVRQLTFGAKYLIYDPFKNKKEEKPNIYSWKANHSFKIKWKEFIPALSGYAGVNLNFSDNPFNFTTLKEPQVSPKVMLIAQNHFGTRWVLVTNIAYDKIATEFKSLNYVMTLTRGINEHLSLFIENQGYKGTFYSDFVLRGGAAYLFDKDIQIDASLGTSTKSTPSIFYGGIGMSWRFRENYKDIKIKEGKEEEKGKDDKTKPKDQKRLDEIESGDKKN